LGRPRQQQHILSRCRQSQRQFHRQPPEDHSEHDERNQRRPLHFCARDSQGARIKSNQCPRDQQDRAGKSELWRQKPDSQGGDQGGGQSEQECRREKAALGGPAPGARMRGEAVKVYGGQARCKGNGKKRRAGPEDIGAELAFRTAPNQPEGDDQRQQGDQRLFTKSQKVAAKEGQAQPCPARLWRLARQARRSSAGRSDA